MSTGGLSRARLERMQDVMASHVDRGVVPSIVTLVSRRGEVRVDAIGTKAFGDRDPMRRDTIFRVASVTKPIVAAAAMILVEECALRLDEQATVYYCTSPMLRTQGGRFPVLPRMCQEAEANVVTDRCQPEWQRDLTRRRLLSPSAHRGRPMKTLDIEDRDVEFDLSIPLQGSRVLELRGFDGGHLIAVAFPLSCQEELESIRG